MKNPMRTKFLIFSLLIVLLIYGCTPASAPASVHPLQASVPSQPVTILETNMPLPTDVPYTIADIEKLAGFDVKEPSYLPSGVSFDFATYQKLSPPNVVLHFKMVHEIYGDMGAFFQILQEPQKVAPPDTVSCGETPEGCEVLSIGNLPVVYRLNQGGTEAMDWYAEGFSFRLLRTAGEPSKVYKEELLKVVRSME